MHQVLRGEAAHAVPPQGQRSRGAPAALHQLHEGVLTASDHSALHPFSTVEYSAEKRCGRCVLALLAQGADAYCQTSRKRYAPKPVRRALCISEAAPRNATSQHVQHRNLRASVHAVNS